MEPLKKFSFANFRKDHKDQPPTIPKATPAKKKSLPGPINPLNFIVMAVYKFARKPLLIDINYRIGFYLCIVSVGSVYFDIFRMPSSYFSNKYNIFNQLFVKWAWGWTFSLLFCFIVTTSYIYTGGNTSKMKRHVMRLFVGTIWWYVCTGLFHTIENETGSCHVKIGNKYMVDVSIPNKRICKQKNGGWLGFDISGHGFLLVLCNMWIFEEVQILNQLWNRLDRFVLSNSDVVRSNCVTAGDIVNIKRSYKKLNVNIKIMTAVLSLLTILWDFMLLCTVVYFHNMPSKLTGVLVALCCWFLSYRCLFKCDIDLLPNSPQSDLEEIVA